MKICVMCKWYENLKCGTGLTHWSHHRCTHPKLALPGKTDPVTGAKTYGPHESAFSCPVCKEINDGDCIYFEAKKVCANE